MDKFEQPRPPVPTKPYVYEEFPRILYKAGTPRPQTVKNAEEEERFTALGWGRTPVEETKPFMPMTEMEIALDRQARAHQTTVDSIRERHTEEMRVFRIEHDSLKGNHSKLQAAHGEVSVERQSLAARVAELEAQSNGAADAMREAVELAQQNVQLLAELRTANERADGLVKQVGELTTELDDLRKRHAAQRAVQGANKGERN